MKILSLALGILLILGLPEKGSTATLPNNPPFVVSVSFDRILTENTLTNTRTGEVKVRSTGGVRSFSYRFNTNNTSYFFQDGNSFEMEGPGISGFGQYGLGYNFDTEAGYLDFGISFPHSLVFRYTFNGTVGTFWYEEEEFRDSFPTQKGVLSNVSIDVKIPAAPLPASLPLLMAAFLGLGAWRRRRT